MIRSACASRFIISLLSLFCLFSGSAELAAQSAGGAAHAVTSDIDLTGIWNIQGQPEQQIRIGFPAEKFLIIANLSVKGWGAAQIPYVGAYHGGAVRLPVMDEQSYKNYQASRQAMDHPPQVTVIDSEHITMDDKTFVRSRVPEFERSGCQDAANATTIRPMEALHNAYDRILAHDYNVAACWLLMGALQGSGQTSGALGEAYLEGKGFPQSNERALIWFQQSAAQGWYLSEINLARMYRYGIGTPVDLKKAAQWEHAAKEQAQEEANRAHVAAIAAAEAQARQRASVAATVGLLLGLSILADPELDSPTLNFNVNIDSRTSLQTFEIVH